VCAIFLYLFAISIVYFLLFHNSKSFRNENKTQCYFWMYEYYYFSLRGNVTVSIVVVHSVCNAGVVVAADAETTSML